MYALLWRALPGPGWAKFLQVLVLAGLLVYVLFTWVYPWISDTFVGTDPNFG